MRPPGLVARRVVRSIVALVSAVIGVVLLVAAPVSAHTDVDFTMPTDGAAVGEPVSEITVGFTDPVTLVGSGFEVLDPAGDVLVPVVATDDDRVFLLQLDPPLAGGEAAVRYEVRAEDGHTITGGFTFTVSADAPTTTIAPSTTAPETTTAATTVETTTTAVAASTTPSPTDAPEPSIDPSGATSVPERPSDGSGSSSGLYAAIAVAVALVAGVLLVVRYRSSASG